MDFFANFERALVPARQGKVDCVVHGGDILYRSKVPAELVAMAFQPLKQLADQGMPIYVVPGNHERSGIPYGLLAHHPKIHLFDQPKTYRLDVNGFRLGMLGVSDVSLPMTYGVIVTAGVILFSCCLFLLNRGTGMRT